MTAAEQTRIVDTLTEQIWQRIHGSPAPSSSGSAAHACSCQHVCSPCDVTELVDYGACRVSLAQPSASVDPATAALIDHTMLKPDATRDEIIKICDEAAKFGFASVCVNPTWVPLAA